MTEKEKETLRDVLEKYDMQIYTSQQGDELLSEIEFYSGLGEDFILSVYWDGTAESFAKAFCSYCENFDPYEHASAYICMNPGERQRMKVPSSNKALMKDALDIKKTITKAARELNRRLGEHYGKKGA